MGECQKEAPCDRDAGLDEQRQASQRANADEGKTAYRDGAGQKCSVPPESGNDCKAAYGNRQDEQDQMNALGQGDAPGDSRDESNSERKQQAVEQAEYGGTDGGAIRNSAAAARFTH